MTALAIGGQFQESDRDLPFLYIPVPDYIQRAAGKRRLCWGIAIATHVVILAFLAPPLTTHNPAPLQISLRLGTKPVEASKPAALPLAEQDIRAQAAAAKTTPSRIAPTSTPTFAPSHATNDASPVAAAATPQSPNGASHTAPQTVSTARVDADALRNPKPVYPLLSRRLNEEGTAHVRVRVSVEGAALEVALKQSSGFARLDNAAQEAVARWRFIPEKHGETAVESWLTVPIKFSLLETS